MTKTNPGPGIDADPFTRELYNLQERLKKERGSNSTAQMKKDLSDVKSEAKENVLDLEAWKKVDDNIQALLTGGSEAFYEWTTGMNKMTSTLKDFVKAMASYRSSLTGSGSLPNPTWDKSLTGDKSDTLNFHPKINYEVKMDDTGHIDSKVLVDNQQLPDELMGLFNGGLGAWAATHDHVLQKDPRGGLVLIHKDTINKDPKQIMDKATFDNLKHDPEKGLDKFLTNKFALELTETEGLEYPAPKMN